MLYLKDRQMKYLAGAVFLCYSIFWKVRFFNSAGNIIQINWTLYSEKLQDQIQLIITCQAMDLSIHAYVQFYANNGTWL